jgi:hypothetical protein
MSKIKGVYVFYHSNLLYLVELVCNNAVTSRFAGVGVVGVGRISLNFFAKSVNQGRVQRGDESVVIELDAS